MNPDENSRPSPRPKTQIECKYLWANIQWPKTALMGLDIVTMLSLRSVLPIAPLSVIAPFFVVSLRREGKKRYLCSILCRTA